MGCHGVMRPPPVQRFRNLHRILVGLLVTASIRSPAGNRLNSPASVAPIKNLAPTLHFAAKPSLQFIAITPVS
jgi:hypothetical protein